MKENAYKTSRSICFLALSLVYLLNDHRAVAAPQPIPPEAMFREENVLDVSNQILVDRLRKMVERKQEKIGKEIAELAEEGMEIQSLIDAQTKNQRENQQLYSEEESPPVPPAMTRGEFGHLAEKRNYIALCHFKICNMGRKRQKRSEDTDKTADKIY